MNFKKSLLIFFLLFTVKSIAQQQNIKVIYKAYPRYGSIENDDKIKSKKIPNLYQGVDDAIKSLEYELDIHQNKSHFFLKEILYPDKKVAGLAMGFAGRESVYCDKDSTSYIKVKYILNERHLVSFVPEKNWVITTEKKTIEGFTCYKATIQKTVIIKKDKVKTYEVEAWFCPKLPFSFGPKDALGLPGLILELHDDKVVFLASKIDLDSKKISDLSLKKTTKIISESEFYDIVAIKAKEYFEEKQRKIND